MVHGGQRPERWVRQTNFDNDEAVGYLADRLARLGVEDALAKAGAEPGDLVRIGEREFDWQPTLYAGVEFVPGNRGTDVRLEEKSIAPVGGRAAGRPQGPPAAPRGRAGRRRRIGAGGRRRGRGIAPYRSGPGRFPETFAKRTCPSVG